MKLDYKEKDPEQRMRNVETILDFENPSPAKLEYMSDYLLYLSDKNQTKKERKQDYPIITKNRQATVSKRQVSYEEMVSNLETGEDGLHNLIKNDKNQILDPKDPINKKDMRNVPGVKECLDLLDSLQQQFAFAEGKAKYSLKRQMIETWQQMYILKAAHYNPPVKGKLSNQMRSMIFTPLEEHVYLGKDGFPHTDAKLSLIVPQHVSFLLTFYPQLKEECFDLLNSDMHFVLLDLENLAVKALLPNYQTLFDLLVLRIDGLMNSEIVEWFKTHYGITHNEQYYSVLWKHRIPKLIAEQAQKNWLVWYYTNVEYGNWKTCLSCGQTKLAHPLFFSSNTTSDGFYSICKECRAKKYRERKERSKNGD